MRTISSFFVFLLLVGLSFGCTSKYSDFFPYYDDGRPKPSIALLPVADISQNKPSWDVAGELYDAMKYRLMREGKVFIPPEDQIIIKAGSCTTQELMDTSNLRLFERFQPSQYVVIVELLDYKQVPYVRGKITPLYIASISADNAKVLMVKLRLRIIDIRGKTPRIVRQEIIESNHMIEENALADSARLKKTEAYSSSPIGIAHARIVRDMVKKIDDICCKKM